MSEVYCKDCRYLHHNFFDYNLLSCERKYGDKHKVKHSVYGEIEEVLPLPTLHPESRNDNLQCRYFEPKLMVRIWRKLFK